MKYLFSLLVLFASATPTLGQQLDWLDYRGLVEIQAFANHSNESWYSGGVSKLRYDDDSFPIQLGKAGLNLDFHLTDTLWARTLTTAYTDPEFDPNLVESYLHYRPVPKGPLRIRIKAGAFYLPLSIENTGIAWSSPYSTTVSVINSWVGEELRVAGSEVALDWSGRARQSAHDFSLYAGIYGFNDGAGTILANRGWAAHDRQAGLEDKLRLPSDFPGQEQYNHPFWEIDDRAGYYVGAAWSYMDRVKMAALYYDNRGDPSITRKGEVAWLTRFDHISGEIDLGHDFKLIGQYMIGDTLATPPGYTSDTDYKAWYLMLTRLMGKHRVSFRYEKFDADYLELLSGIKRTSWEAGDSWMLAYRYQLSAQMQLGLEWLRIASDWNNRFGITGISSETARQLLFNISYRF